MFHTVSQKLFKLEGAPYAKKVDAGNADNEGANTTYYVMKQHLNSQHIINHIRLRRSSRQAGKAASAKGDALVRPKRRHVVLALVQFPSGVQIRLEEQQWQACGVRDAGARAQHREFVAKQVQDKFAKMKTEWSASKPSLPSPTGNLSKAQLPMHYGIMLEYWRTKVGYKRESLMSTDDYIEDDNVVLLD
ncbi:hypothetical protein AaE_008023, partial [Aphanomyces astaci]